VGEINEINEGVGGTDIRQYGDTGYTAPDACIWLDSMSRSAMAYMTVESALEVTAFRIRASRDTPESR
jgi:hypothetical protein